MDENETSGVLEFSFTIFIPDNARTAVTKSKKLFRLSESCVDETTNSSKLVVGAHPKEVEARFVKGLEDPLAVFVVSIPTLCKIYLFTAHDEVSSRTRVNITTRNRCIVCKYRT